MIGGAVVVALLAAAAAAGCAHLKSRVAAWLLGITVPLLIAYVAYWTPVWTGEDSSEYASWAPVFIVPWYLVGVVASLITLAVVRRMRMSPKRDTQPAHKTESVR